MNNRDITFYGAGLLDMLFITFLVLRLVGTISWSWWWVTAPLWGPIALIFGLQILLFLYLLLSDIFDEIL